MNNHDSITRSKTVTQQIEELLRERIQKGIYPADQRMPSEDKLAQELCVSRASVRTAMAGLAAEGYVHRRHGDGTYPCPRVFEIGFRAGKMWDIMRQIQESGRVAELRPLEQGPRVPGGEEIELLALSADEPVLAMRRLFLADGKPVAVINNIIRTAGMTEVIPDNIASLTPLDFLACFHGQKPGTSTVYFNAVLADEELAGLLQIEPGAPLLKMSGVLLDRDGSPLMAETELYPGDEGFRMRAELI